MAKHLIKSSDKKVCGVAGGVAEYFDIDPTLVRVGFVVLGFCFFPLAIVAYLALAVMMPSRLTAAPGSWDAAAERIEDGEETREHRNRIGWALVGLLGVLFVIAKFDIFSWTSWGLTAAVLIGVGVVLLTLRSRVT